MKEAVESVIKLLAERVAKETKSEDNLRNTQAALNLAHVLSTMSGIENQKK